MVRHVLHELKLSQRLEALRIANTKFLDVDALICLELEHQHHIVQDHILSLWIDWISGRDHFRKPIILKVH